MVKFGRKLILIATLILVMVAVVFPVKAFASWWNPFSWSIFSHLFFQPAIEIVAPTATIPSNENEIPEDGLANFNKTPSIKKETTPVKPSQVSIPTRQQNEHTKSSTETLIITERSNPTTQPTQQPIEDQTKSQPSVQVRPSTSSSVTLLSPNGGEYFTQGDDMVIEWLSVNSPRVYFALTDVNGNERITNLGNPSLGSSQYVWYISQNVAPGIYRMKIGAYSPDGVCGDGSCSRHDFLATDTSDSVFTISQQESPPSAPIPSNEPIPQYLIKEKSISVLTPVQDTTFYIGHNPYSDGRTSWAPIGEVIPFSWRWTGPVTKIMPVVYLHNLDTGKDLPEWYLVGTFNNYDISHGEITSFKMCIESGFMCPTEFLVGRYQLKICEFPIDNNPNNNALYPIGQSPICSVGPQFNISNRPESQYADTDINGNKVR